MLGIIQQRSKEKIFKFWMNVGSNGITFYFYWAFCLMILKRIVAYWLKIGGYLVLSRLDCVTFSQTIGDFPVKLIFCCESCRQDRSMDYNLYLQ